jgi:hypothetical protein
LCREEAGVLVGGQTVVSGIPVNTRVRRSTYRGLAVQAADWLADLAGHHPQPERVSVWWDRLVEPVLTEFARLYGAVVEPSLLATSHQVLTGLGSLPLVCEHRDFTPSNVLVTPTGGLAVVDWETAQLDGLPALDVLYFLAHLSFELDGAYATDSYEQSLRASLDPSSFTGAVQAECLERYARRVGLERAALRPLRLVLWLRQANREYRWRAKRLDDTPRPDDLRRNRFLRIWEADVRAIVGA